MIEAADYACGCQWKRGKGFVRLCAQHELKSMRISAAAVPFHPEAPVMKTTRIGKGEGERWQIWCAFCWRHHTHSAEPGHRVAHCGDSRSPYADTGYTLAAPEDTDE